MNKIKRLFWDKIDLVLLIGLLTCVGIFGGCTHILPGNDPVVVNAERTETMAKASFDAVVNFDNADRGFWRTNAPAFHNFCEWLRTPVPVGGLSTTPTLPRGKALIYNVDQDKQTYAQLGGSTNALWASLKTLMSSVSQAQSWMNIVTNKTQ